MGRASGQPNAGALARDQFSDLLGRRRGTGESDLQRSAREPGHVDFAPLIAQLSVGAHDALRQALALAAACQRPAQADLLDAIAARALAEGERIIARALTSACAQFGLDLIPELSPAQSAAEARALLIARSGLRSSSAPLNPPELLDAGVEAARWRAARALAQLLCMQERPWQAALSDDARRRLRLRAAGYPASKSPGVLPRLRTAGLSLPESVEPDILTAELHAWLALGAKANYLQPALADALAKSASRRASALSSSP